ncbi:MAG: serine/threonine-protein kinase [Polyangiaceae bacterium]
MRPGDLVSQKYRLLRQLGRGGMGSVWAARNELTDRDFAVKFLLPELARNRDALDRFFLEARACGQIKHPAVVAVYDMGQAEDGTPYLVMELMEGEGLDQRLSRAGTFRPGEAAAFVAFVARGLDEAHVRGLVHRDLKPANIFFALDDRGEVVPKVLDFGVSKATAAADPKFVRTNTGAVLGSPAYMSPEQARGDEDIDSRSDVWSLGVILYEALTGRAPFDGANYNQLMVNILTSPPRPAIELNPLLPPDLCDVIERALSKDRQKRIPSAAELANELEAIAARITGTPYPGMQFRQRTRTLQPISPSPTPTETWVDVVPPPKPPHRQSHLAVWVSGAVLALATVAFGAIAIARSAPPTVDVAPRSLAILNDGRARLVGVLSTDPPKTIPTETTRTPVTGTVVHPDELPTVKPSSSATVTPATTTTSAPSATSTSSASPTTSTTKPKKKKTGDAHGGVTNPGF